MIVHHPGGLHEGIADCGADKAETAGLEIGAHGIRFFCLGRYLLQRFPVVDFRLPPYELPDILIESAEFLLNSQKSAGVVDSGLYLKPVADNAGVVHQTFKLALVEFGDLGGIEIGERLAEVLALVEYRGPGQSSLEAIEHYELEQLTIIVERGTPLVIVVFY